MIAPLCSFWFYFGVLMIGVFAYPGLQQLCFRYPDYQSLYQVSGRLSFVDQIYQHRRGQPFYIVNESGRLAFGCRAVKSYSAKCFDDDKVMRLQGKHATVWWYPQSKIVFSERDNTPFQVEVDGEMLLKFDDLVGRYTKQTNSVIGYFSIVVLLSYLPAVFLFRIYQYQYKEIASNE